MKAPRWVSLWIRQSVGANWPGNDKGRLPTSCKTHKASGPPLCGQFSLRQSWWFTTPCLRGGTWLSERRCENDELTSVASFCNPVLNPAAKASAELGSLLLDTVHAAWGPLVGSYGPVLSWPQERLRGTRRGILIAIGQMYRKLIEPWRRYPWKLYDAPLLEAGLQRDRARAFFAELPCCLDGFSAKLKAWLQTPEALLQEKTLTFLREVFDRVVLTSTFIERAFARLSRWCDRKGPKPTLATLAAKNAVYHFRYLTELWRERGLQGWNLDKREEPKVQTYLGSWRAKRADEKWLAHICQGDGPQTKQGVGSPVAIAQSGTARALCNAGQGRQYPIESIASQQGFSHG